MVTPILARRVGRRQDRSNEPFRKNRIIWALAIAAALFCAVLGALWLADAYASEAATYCSTSLRPWQWAGCAMAVHEGLAAGLIGTAGALFAGWLAFDAVQEQIAQERERELHMERPWLFLEGATVSRRDIAPGQPIVPNDWFIKLRWKNVGRNPAIIERCEFKLVDKDVISMRPDYADSQDLLTVAMVAQNTGFELTKSGQRAALAPKMVRRLSSYFLVA